MKRDDRVFIKHILDSAKKINEFCDGKSREDLDLDEKLALAVVRLFEIIGEASNSVSDDFRNIHPEIPWANLISMRNRLIHGYFDINYDIVWNTIKQDIPELIILIDKI